MPPKRKRSTNPPPDTSSSSSDSSSSDDSSSSSEKDIDQLFDQEEVSSDEEYLPDDSNSTSDNDNSSADSNSSTDRSSSTDEEQKRKKRKLKKKVDTSPIILLIPPSPHKNSANNNDPFDFFNPTTNRRELRKRKLPNNDELYPVSKRAKKVDITENIKTLDDFIKIIDKYQYQRNIAYSFDIHKLKALKAPLLELKAMVGMVQIKSQVLDQIKFLLSHLNDNDQMLHTCIYGPPGSGKTMVGSILAKIYHALGFSNGKFKTVKRSDLVGGYLGQTAIKTQEVFNQNRGGVIFIDEVYSMGNGNESGDSYSKEAIDTINQNLTEMKKEIIVIIAGYQTEIDRCFFSVNPGLNRRFPFRYKIDKYTTDQLYQIFESKINGSGWNLIYQSNNKMSPAENLERQEELKTSFSQHCQYFTQQGGDMETLSQMCKLAHTRRVFGRHQLEPKVITSQDLKEGLKLFISNEEVKNRPKHAPSIDFEKEIKPLWYA